MPSAASASGALPDDAVFHPLSRSKAPARSATPSQVKQVGGVRCPRAVAGSVEKEPAEPVGTRDAGVVRERLARAGRRLPTLADQPLRAGLHEYSQLQRVHENIGALNADTRRRPLRLHRYGPAEIRHARPARRARRAARGIRPDRLPGRGPAGRLLSAGYARAVATGAKFRAARWQSPSGQLRRHANARGAP